MQEPGADDLLFVPLGGSGEIGMNLNLYGHDGRWLMVDCGIGFSQESGTTEVIMPDPRFIERRRDRLEAIVITHAHEDHLGAVPHLWTRLRVPVYATPFAAAVLRRKLSEAQLLHEVPLIEIDRDAPLELGPFTLRFVDVTHSTVESQAILVETPLGTVLHTGDFKLDDQPLVGPKTDFDALEAAGGRGILAVVADSTNATKAVASRSEGELRESLASQLADVGDRRIAVASFSSNIARVATLLEIADRLERHPVFVGRSLLRMVAAARECGYLPPGEQEVHPRDFAYLPPARTMLICTGTQGEPGSATDRISRDDHRDIALDPGDLVLFSSKIIPGNEDPIARLHANLRQRRYEVVSELEGFVHVSGHPGQPELRRVYELTRPQVVVPVHGEPHHMSAHAELAQSMGLAAVVPFNGAVVRLAPGPAEVFDVVENGRLTLERDNRPPRGRPTPKGWKSGGRRGSRRR